MTGRFRGGLERELQRTVCGIREEDPCTPIHILVGSNLLGLYLRRKLAERTGGLFNVRFLTFVDLVSLLGWITAPSTARTLSPAAAYLLIDDLLPTDGMPPSFGRHVRRYGTVEALMATFNDLSEGGYVSVDTARLAEGAGADGRSGPDVAWVLRRFAQFRERVEECGGDIASRFATVIDTIGAGPFEHPLLVYGFYDFNELQLQLVEAIAERFGAVLFVPGGEGELFEFTGKLLHRLEERGFTISGVDTQEEGIHAERRTSIVSAFDEEDEVRSIIRMIVERAREGAVRFKDVSILVPSFERYRPLLEQELDEAGIPFSIGAKSLLAAGTVARAFLHLLKLLSGNIDRQALVDFLLIAPLATSVADDACADPVSVWVRKSAEDGMVGENRWSLENGKLLERITRARERGEEGEEAVCAVRAVGEILEKLESAQRALNAASTWGDCTRSFIRLVEDLFIPSTERDDLCTRVAGLSDLDGLATTVHFGVFSNVIESYVLASHTHIGRYGRGVSVLPFGASRGLSFKLVFIPGLVESTFPGGVRQDPLLRDDERARLDLMTGGGASLSSKSERLSEEVLLFALALDAAENELVLSHSRFDAGSGREEIPSSLLHHIEGYSADGDHAPPLTSYWIKRSTADRAVEPVGADEYDYIVTTRYGGGGSGHLPDNPFFTRGAELIGARWGKRRFTPYDGVFASPEALEELNRILESGGWSFSPTSMESYAGCPFAYLLENILEVRSLEEPERIISITPLQRGILVHAILARIYTALRERDLLPLERASGETVARIAREVIDSQINRYPAHQPVGLPAFWEMEKRKIADSVSRFLREEMGEEDGFTPRYFERPFGGTSGEERVVVDTGSSEVSFHGRIDRIDTGPGDAFRVIDYKTGRLEGREDELAGGLFLQLPIYLLAAARMLERPIESGTALYRRIGPPGEKRSVAFSGTAWVARKRELDDILDTITGGIAGGLFFTAPSSGVCRRCSVQAACPSSRSRIFEAKIKDKRCHRFLAMQGPKSGEVREV
ncbi:MAG: exodeoxyribonuclease V subunit gamma [bacterium]|nr:MAG: exodeoxyribonuclease V subunit gamma [bacterium]